MGYFYKIQYYKMGVYSEKTHFYFSFFWLVDSVSGRVLILKRLVNEGYETTFYKFQIGKRTSHTLVQLVLSHSHVIIIFDLSPNYLAIPTSGRAPTGSPDQQCFLPPHHGRRMVRPCG